MPMLDINLLRREPEKVKEAIRTKNADPGLVDKFLELDEAWRRVTAELEKLRAEQNRLSQRREVEAAKANKEKIKAAEEKLSELETRRREVWEKIPNLPSQDTPIGKDETGNRVLRQVGKPREFDFEPRDHMALGEKLGLIDTRRAAQVSGTRFGYLMGEAALLEFALIWYALETLTDESVLKSIAQSVKPDYNPKPFLPVIPPVLIRPEVFNKMARLYPNPEDKYYLPQDDLYLIGSAEHTLGPLHMDETLAENDLPRRYVGFSTAFRREAGSYGKDTRGILRVHQFDKVEMESFVLPEDGIYEQNFFVAIQEYLMRSLELPYQVVITSTGDQGDPDARHVDIETWLPGEGRYRETHSADYMTDYQARRLNTKVKRASGKTEFVHMNDATVFAIGRTLIAILENYQTREGKVEIPKVLQKYVGREIIG
jgi:seryl-tRNA synthetase